MVTRKAHINLRQQKKCISSRNSRNFSKFTRLSRYVNYFLFIYFICPNDGDRFNKNFTEQNLHQTSRVKTTKRRSLTIKLSEVLKIWLNVKQLYSHEVSCGCNKFKDSIIFINMLQGFQIYYYTFEDDLVRNSIVIICQSLPQISSLNKFFGICYT